MGFTERLYNKSNVTTSATSQTSNKDLELSLNSRTSASSQTTDDLAILNSIDQIYFNKDENFDFTRLILNNLPKENLNDNFDTDLIFNFNELKQQQQCVSKNVLNMILKQQPQCVQQCNSILELQNHLQNIVTSCQEARRQLQLSQKQFVVNLKILSNYRKRQILKQIWQILNTIKTLSTTLCRLNELLNSENNCDYQTIILLLKECNLLAGTYRHFTCVAQLSQQFKEVLDMCEEHLDMALANICFNFSEVVYKKINEAYKKLGKEQISIDQLNMHFTTAIHNTAFNIVHKYVSEDHQSKDNLLKTQYKELCSLVHSNRIVDCLVDLCKHLWILLSNYYQITKFHKAYYIDKEQQTHMTELNQPQEEVITQNYILKKLDSGLIKIWFDIQSKISIFLNRCVLVNFQFENFLQILNILNQLINIGETFTNKNCKSDELYESIRKQSLNYLHQYHISHLDELRIFLENETWQICPVKNNFNIFQLKEFKCLKNVLLKSPSQLSTPKKNADIVSIRSIDNVDFKSSLEKLMNSIEHSSNNLNESFDTKNLQVEETESSIVSKPSDSENETSMKNNKNLSPKREKLIHQDQFDSINLYDVPESFIYLSSENSTPFDLLESKLEDSSFYDMEESIYSSDGTDTDDDTETVKTHRMFILTNTTLGVLRQMGKYLQLCRLLRAISTDVFKNLIELFDFYFYTVHYFFALNNDLNQLLTLSYRLELFQYNESMIKLSSTLKRIEDNLILNQILENKDASNEVKDRTHKITKPELNKFIVDLNNSETLFGLSVRIVAVESLIYLSDQFETVLQTYLANLSFNNSYCCITTSLAKDLRRPIYLSSIVRFFDMRQIIQQMSKIDWEIKEVVSEHNSYVDVLLRDVQIFAMRLKNIENHVFVSNEVRNLIWDSIAQLIVHTLVEGYSNVKKCSDGGRALMQLDFTQFVSKFEKITNMHPMAHRDYVEQYIKAYYLPEQNFEQFVRKNVMRYTTEHLIGLITSVHHTNKKTKNKLYNLVKDLEKK